MKPCAKKRTTWQNTWFLYVCLCRSMRDCLFGAKNDFLLNYIIIPWQEKNLEQKYHFSWRNLDFKISKLENYGKWKILYRVTCLPLKITISARNNIFIIFYSSLSQTFPEKAGPNFTLRGQGIIQECNNQRFCFKVDFPPGSLHNIMCYVQTNGYIVLMDNNNGKECS